MDEAESFACALHCLRHITKKCDVSLLTRRCISRRLSEWQFIATELASPAFHSYVAVIRSRSRANDLVPRQCRKWRDRSSNAVLSKRGLDDESRVTRVLLLGLRFGLSKTLFGISNLNFDYCEVLIMRCGAAAFLICHSQLSHGDNTRPTVYSSAFSNKASRFPISRRFPFSPASSRFLDL